MRNTETTSDVQLSPRQPEVAVRYASLGTRAATVTCVPGSFCACGPSEKQFASDPNFSHPGLPYRGVWLSRRVLCVPDCCRVTLVNLARPGVHVLRFISTRSLFSLDLCLSSRC